MKVLTLLSSARPKSNTAQVLDWVEEELQEMGHEVERVAVFKKKINGCLGCAKCRENETEPGCIQKDDGPGLMDKMIRADALIYASPLYMWGFPAQIKAFMDRTYCLVSNYGSPAHSSLVEGQRQALLMTAADKYENNGEGAVTTFRNLADYHKAVEAGELFIGGCTSPENLGPEVRDQAIKLARQVAGTD